MDAWRKASPAQLNFLQAVVDFMLLMKNPNWLQDLEASARRITEQNKLTDAEAARLEEAGRIIQRAGDAQDALQERQLQFEQQQADTHKKQSDLMRQERDLDTLKKQLNDQVLLLAGQKSDQQRKQKELDAQELAHKNAVAAFDKRHQEQSKVLEKREQAVTERENKHRQAAALLAG